MSVPPVSVVLIFFNDERFLEEAIASVLAQRHADWELILADDGSHDASTAIAKLHAASRPSQIFYVDHPGHANRGISATRNLGIARARGDYVAFLDSDDVWEPDKLAEQMAILANHPEVGLLFGASLYWHSWAAEAASADRLMPIGAEHDVVTRPPELLTTLYPLGSGTPPCPSSCIVRRDVLTRVGAFEEHMPGLYDDQGFLTKAYLDTPTYVSSRCWDRYRRHPGAVTVTASTAEYDAVRRYFLAWYGEYLRATGVDDARLWKAVQRAWLPYRYPRLFAARRRAGRVRARLRRLHARAQRRPATRTAGP